MSMARRTLRPWAVWLTLVLLFALWATASYACPRQSAAASPAVAADLPPCHGAALPSAMDPEQPQLCKAHCESGSQSAQASVNAGPSASYSLWAVLDWRPVTLRPLASRFGEAFAPAVPLPGEPPIYLALRVLRN
ncbi:MAG TPA: hypothetical protein VLJ62_30240 [Burkholderiaceae bacterium]|nr:hypothetical protein [Burkholderiaceae bacterium]